MKLEQQVPTLELCKKLKELGYPQEGLFWWIFHWMDNEKKKDWEIGFDRGWGIETSEVSETKLVAPTAVELGEWLVKEHNGLCSYYWSYIKERWECNTHIKDEKKGWQNNSQMLHMEHDETEANARAKMLIWLVENDYVSFKEQDND